MSPIFAAVVAVSLLAAVWGYLWWRNTLRLARGRQLLRAGATLVDVGTAQQYAAEHLPGAINIPAGDIARRQEELGEHERPIVVYARSSLRSSAAAQALRGVGFHTVLSVGTLRRWRTEAPDEAAPPTA